jgi:hypothetical protein
MPICRRRLARMLSRWRRHRRRCPSRSTSPARRITGSGALEALVVLACGRRGRCGNRHRCGKRRGRNRHGEAATDCLLPARGWLNSLETAFYPEFQDAPGGITSSVYADVDTSEGTAYYVAITVDGVSGQAVFGTSDPPHQSDPGLIAAANPAARQLSDLGADIPEGSPAGVLLQDDDGVSAVQSCRVLTS